MSQKEVQRLGAELQAANDSDEQTKTLKAYLKSQVPASSGNLFGVQKFERTCGEGVSADECKGIIDSCLNGDGADMHKCTTFLKDITTNYPGRNKALADGIKSMDGRMARKVCENLGIDYNAPNNVDFWIKDIISKNPTAGNSINSNAPLMEIIKSFSVAAANPSVNSKSLEFSRRKAALSSALPIPVRTPRLYEHIESGFRGGGIKAKLVANTYEQYTDSLKRLASMSGGGAELNRTHDEIAHIYNSFQFSLKAKGKEIDKNDDLKIRHEIDKLAKIEKNLSDLVSYITRYNSLLNSKDANVQSLIAKGTINIDLLEQLNLKYEQLKKKHEKKSYGIISITDAINKVLTAADRVESKMDAIQECLGPKCEEDRLNAEKAAAAAGAARGYRFGGPTHGLNIHRGTPRTAAEAAAEAEAVAAYNAARANPGAAAAALPAVHQGNPLRDADF